MIQIESNLKNKGINIAYSIAANIEVSQTPIIVDKKLAEAEERVRREFRDGQALNQHPYIKSYRKLLWSFNIDPTKTRPSSEALIRRVIRGRSIPRINSIVDIGNLVSLETLIPIGLYDFDKIKTPLTITLTKGGEEFEPIGGRKIKLRPGIPVIKDSQGTIVHIYPHRDSTKTMVTDDTKTLLIIAAGAPGIPTKNLAQAVNMIIDLIKSFNLRATIQVSTTII